jgi:DNA-binding transcriptional regulator LsrR (DeoR family)
MDIYVTDTDETQVMVRAAWLYHIEGLTQGEVAKRLGLSRIKVNRLLKQALEKGIVEVNVQIPDSLYLDLERELRHKFHLSKVLVTLEIDEAGSLYPVLASALANYLKGILQPGILVGLGLGRTVSHLPEFYKSRETVDCTFIVLTGGLSQTVDNQGMPSVLERIAEKVGGKVKYIYAPIVASSQEIKSAIIRDRAIQENLDLARKSDVALFSVGPPGDAGLLFKQGYMNAQDIQEISKDRCAGDAIGRFFDPQGNELEIGFNRRVIGISLDDLRDIPHQIVVAGGEGKRQAILGALRGELADVLITDAGTARWLVSKEGSGESPAQGVKESKPME